MKNQYVADINDYRKYGILRTLSDCGKIRMGVCWMLTPDDNRTDGQFTNYLNLPGQWKQYDPALFERLTDCIRDGERHINRIESIGVLQNALFHSDLLSDIPGERGRYFEDMHERLQGVDLVFFDPDNGLEIKSRPYGRKQSSKFLYWHELTHVFNAGKSILVYQHFIRENREQFITRLTSELCMRLNAPEVFSIRTPHVVFFLVPQSEHTQHFKERAIQLEELWNDQVNVTVHSRPK